MSVKLVDLAANWNKFATDYRPSAFWFWNSEMDNDGMRRTVENMAKAGIREFLIHPVHGMLIEYLSDEFFEKYRYALTLAKEHNLKVWVYDEFGWPSGNAGGILLRDHPECLGWYLAFEKNEDGKVIAKPTQTDRILDNTMGAPWTKSERGYLDTLSVPAVSRYIEYTHERIYRETGELFKDTIVGFFTDEPVTMIGSFDGGPGGWAMVGMPWTPELPKVFEQTCGYSIEDRYADLADVTQTDLKADYWKVVTQMHMEAYHGQIADWCHRHSVKSTGHLGEDRPLQQVRFAGSAYQALSRMDEPGIDYLGWGTEPDDRYIDHVLVPSIARHAGRSRVYCEAFGITSYSIRLGEMLKRMDMFGIYGINDIALMGFQQSQKGIRKLTYWPPVFTDAPWWNFYSDFRESSARSISITNLGKPVHRYALMYPQAQLEQEDIFKTDFWTCTDKGSAMIDRLIKAVYDSGDTVEYIFPEMIGQGTVRDGKIVFPNAEYEAILAPSDILAYADTSDELERLKSDGAEVLDGTVDEVEAQIKSTSPLWNSYIHISALPEQTSVRVFQFDYPDGKLFAVRNVTAETVKITVNSEYNMTLWDSVNDCKSGITSGFAHKIEAHGTTCISITEKQLTEITELPTERTAPMDVVWTVNNTQGLNTARLNSVRFIHPEKGPIDAVDYSIVKETAGRSYIGIPTDFRGFTSIDFEAEFICGDKIDDLGITFENGYLSSLAVNGKHTDLTNAKQIHIWDQDCRIVDITESACKGVNRVSGTMTFDRWETTVENHAFLWMNLMPCLDVFLAGSFRLCGNVIDSDDKNSITLPLDLHAAGWAECYGGVTLSAEVDVPQSVRAVVFNAISEDCLEIRIDGKKTGRRILRPYRFDLQNVTPGKHKIELDITSTSSSLMGTPGPWGLVSAEWII